MKITKLIWGLLVAVLTVFIFISVACSGAENVPAVTPTIAIDPAQQREDLLKQLVGDEKNGYATSNFMFELNGKSAYDKLQALADSSSKPILLQFLNKDGKIVGELVMSGFVNGDEISFPVPDSFIAENAFNADEVMRFQTLIYPEQTLLSFSEGNYVFNNAYGIYTVKLSSRGSGSLLKNDSLPRGNISNLKPMDFVYLKNSLYGFISGQVITGQKNIVEVFGVLSHIHGADLGGSLVVALKKDGTPVVVGMIIDKIAEDTYVVLDINVLLAQKATLQQ